MPSASPQPRSDLAGRVADLRAALAQDGGALDALDALDDEGRLELLHELELLSRTIGAVGARVQVAFHASQVAAQLEAGVPPSRAGRAVPDDLAHARMTSPYWGSRDLTCARALCAELPLTLAALTDGVINPHQARIVAEATTTLEPADRAEVDRRLSARLPGSSTKEIEAATRALVYEVDPAGFVRRARRAAADRGLSLRPCPDVMGLLSARLPAPQAIAAYQALRAAAEAKRAGGDPRTLNQLMADELYERATGRTVVDGVDVEVGLVITDLALFAGDSTAAELTGYGPVPAELARELLRPRTDAGVTKTAHQTSEADQDDQETDQDEAVPAQAASAASERACPDGGRCTDFSCSLVHGAPAPPDPAPRSLTPPGPTPPGPTPTLAPPGGASSTDSRTDVTAGAARVWLRRLLTDPVTGTLTGRDPRRRLFTGGLRAFLISRDRTCRNSWCGAPIRHLDHVTRHRDDGRTEADNGRGLCARCNLARERTRQRSPASSDYRGPPPLLDGLGTQAGQE